MSKVDILFQRSFKTLRALIIVYAIEPKTATSNKSAVRNHTMTGILSIDSEWNTRFSQPVVFSSMNFKTMLFLNTQ